MIPVVPQRTVKHAPSAVACPCGHRMSGITLAAVQEAMGDHRDFCFTRSSLDWHRRLSEPN